MTILEMHIDLDVNGQRLNSNLYGDVRPEEKDLIINRAIKSFVNRRSSPKTNIKKEGYEESQKRIVDLESITTTAPIKLYKKDNYTVKGILPPDYYQWTSARATTIYGCQNISSNIVNTTVYKTVCLFSIPNDSVDFYKQLAIIVKKNSSAGVVSVIVFNLDDYPTYLNGFVDVEEKFSVYNLIIDALSQNSAFDLRWEKYDGKNYYNKFLITSTTDYDIINVQVISSQLNVTTTPFTTSFVDYNVTGNFPVKENANVRIVSSEFYNNMVNSSMGRSAYDSVLAKIEDDIIELSHSNNFIPTTLDLTYIKEPAKVNIKIGRNCDITSTVHDEIMNIALELLKSRLDGTYQQIKTENLINE